jgi:hypothetical protein
MSQDINNTIATSKTRRVIKNLRWYVLVLFLLGVTVNYITRNSWYSRSELKRASGSPPSNTPDRRRVPDRLYHFPAPVRLAD